MRIYLGIYFYYNILLNFGIKYYVIHTYIHNIYKFIKYFIYFSINFNVLA